MIPSEEDDFLKEVIDPKLDMNSTEFNATAFLAAKHADTKYSALVAELERLKRSTSDKTEQLKALVASHFDQYLSCHEAIREVAEEIRAHESDSERLREAFRDLKATTDKTLSLMLQRCEEQRKTRHALAVLARFRTFFEIPARMRASLSQRDYAKLVEDYLQLKAHAGKANMAILKPVLEAAQKTACQANDTFLKVLHDPDASQQELKTAIQAIDDLGLTSDAALLCVKQQLTDIERILTSLNGSAIVPDAASKAARVPVKAKDRLGSAAAVVRSSAEIIHDCGAIVGRFKRGLWAVICDTISLSTLSAKEQEAIHTSTSDILSTCVRLLREQTLYTTNVTADTVASLHDIFVHLDSLRPCPDSVLNAKLDALKAAFCEQVRTDVLLAFATATTHAAEEHWAESVEQQHTLWLAGVATVEEANSSLLMQRDKPPVLNTIARAFLAVFCGWWHELQPVLILALETNTSPTEDGHARFCATLLQSVVAHAQSLVAVFAQSVALQLEPESDPGSYGCLVLVANCLALQGHAEFISVVNELRNMQADIASLSQPLAAAIEASAKLFVQSRVSTLEETLVADESYFVGGDDAADYGDVRQYVFRVLHLLVTWRGQIEFCVDTTCPEIVHALLVQCGDALLRFFEARAQSADEASAEATWLCTHLLVEATFFRHALAAFLQRPVAWDAFMATLEPKTSRDVVAGLVSQVQLQTQMYRLSLRK
ncbi:hypothetical protein ACHHYP_08329 [Achlya hypogyna]|uniref:Exocyst complex component n=1 Tax=Achlya hypogyna TaxID=1202772 RepID=A0A1V9ZKQ3_ACHHY|nr:hypothetical protein ACHHYP_08329 [Achlya hypogyna]